MQVIITLKSMIITVASNIQCKTNQCWCHMKFKILFWMNNWLIHLFCDFIESLTELYAHYVHDFSSYHVHFPHRVKQCRSKILKAELVLESLDRHWMCRRDSKNWSPMSKQVWFNKGPILIKSKAVTSTTQTTHMSQVCGKYDGDVSLREKKSRSSVKQ